MNTQNTDSNDRPLGYWLTAVDRLLAAEFAAAFENEGVTRRDWRLLNAIDGTAVADRPLPEHKLGRLMDLGWIEAGDGDWTLTDSGRTAKERLGAVVDGIRTKVTDAAGSDDLATTLAALERIARALGWDESGRLPRKPHRAGRGHRGFGPRHRFGRGPGFDGPVGPHRDDERLDDEDGFARHGFGRRRGFAPGDGFARGRRGHAFDAECGAARHHGEPRRGDRFDDPRSGHPRALRVVARTAQHAYERGFDAGFERGRGVR